MPSDQLRTQSNKSHVNDVDSNSIQMSPDIRKHRGAHPEDRQLFRGDQCLGLRAAVSELSWLLTRNYSIKGALKLVGDRHALTERQRLAVARAASSDQSQERRHATRREPETVRGGELIVD